MDMTIDSGGSPARTARFMRELQGVRDEPHASGDEDVRYWRRIGAMFGVTGASIVLSLILWAGVATAGAGIEPPPAAEAAAATTAH